MFPQLNLPAGQRFYAIEDTNEVWDTLENCLIDTATINIINSDYYNDWLESDSRIRVKPDNIWFDPTCKKRPKDPDDIYINTFNGLPLEPLSMSKPDDIEKLSKPIRELLSSLCNHDAVLESRVLDWLSAPLQDLGLKTETAIVVSSNVMGAGVSLFFSIIMSRIYGDYAVTLQNNQIAVKYNSWAENKLYVVMENIHPNLNNTRFSNTLEDLILKHRIKIWKNISQVKHCENYSNCVLISADTDQIVYGFDFDKIVLNPEKSLPRSLADMVSYALKDPAQTVLRAFYTYLVTRR